MRGRTCCWPTVDGWTAASSLEQRVVELGGGPAYGLVLCFQLEYFACDLDAARLTRQCPIRRSREQDDVALRKHFPVLVPRGAGHPPAQVIALDLDAALPL